MDPGHRDEITKAAVEAFETQNNLGVDGIAGPAVWTALINDVINDKLNATPYVYVLVNKVVPQNLTLWDNGVAQYVGVPVNTGAPGADTTDGTYAVFEHVRYSDMKGTNPDGSTYNDPNVPYASYFNGGDALHGFIRASYGSPAEQRLRRDELRRRRAGLAAHADRHPGHRRGPELRHGAAADDHHDDRSPPRRPHDAARRRRRPRRAAPPPRHRRRRTSGADGAGRVTAVRPGPVSRR